ncbi:FxLD family lanthipeptide [Streptacidiphilus cavernicola]|uniref:FxLD family lanthipeptide n=1 Tax=Streptacidiphilus cavernicola TaxID=3342716 RepID=A0ABV6VYC7_9ACTN
MSTQTVERADAQPDAAEDAPFDPFQLDISYIENTPATETVLMCGTGDNCGSSCPSTCTTSG